MRIKLNKITLETFKGLKHFEADLNGNNAMIRSENGVGKTTVYDAFLWALFGKDSTGRSDFNVRPLDAENNPVSGLTVAVEVELEVNGDVIVLRKEQHEHITKDGKISYPKEHIIDGEPGILEKHYKEFIENRIPEDKFKLLTDLSYFNGKLHWTKRREFLLDIAGKMPQPAGLDDLLEKMNGKKIKAYEKILKERQKALEKDRDEINPRIDELQRGLDDFAQNHQNHQGDSEPELIAKRDICQEKVNGLIAQRTDLLESEKQRQERIDKVNHLTCERLHRETQLKNQAGPVDDLLQERAELEKEHADKMQGLIAVRNLIGQAKSAIESAQNQIDSSQLTLNSIRDEYSKIEIMPSDTSISNLAMLHVSECELADSELRDSAKNFLNESDAVTKEMLEDVRNRGNKTKSCLTEVYTKKSELQDELNKLLAEEKVKANELKTAEEAKNKRIAEINETIENRPEPKPADDAEWQKITADIEKLQAEIGEPASQQLENIEAEKGLADTLLNELNKCLNQFDTNEKAAKRIAELEDLNRELTQKIADIEKELDQIAQYKLQESKMVEAKVNEMFQHVTWKLFKYNLNGSIEDICEALYHGVPYPDMSAGQKIYCGIDVINTLSDHYGVEVPLFIDHAESMTLPIEAEGQVIRLYAQEGVKELVVEVEQEAGKAVA